MPLLLRQEDDCKLPYTYKHEIKKFGGFIEKPEWLHFDEETMTYNFDVKAPAEVGVYQITTTATTYQLEHSETFTLTVLSE